MKGPVRSYRHMDNAVHLLLTKPLYPDTPLPGDEESGLSTGFRAIWKSMGLDPENPFGGLVSRGGTVVIKPNWVMDSNPVAAGLDCLITHSSIVLRVMEWAAKAMCGEGTVVIGDAPIQLCDFGKLLSASGMESVVRSVQSRYPGLKVAVEDWRLTLIDRSDGSHCGRAQTRQKYVEQIDERSARDYVLIDVGKDSFLEELSDFADRFRVTCYPPSLMGRHHGHGVHRYLVTRRVFGIDLMVNLPKMKTHAKAGFTGALKNIVGINGHKEYLPHHIYGSYEDGGDCYARPSALKSLYERLSDRFWEHNSGYGPLERASATLALGSLRRLVDSVCREKNVEGSWPGNEVLWRMVLDLNHILYFSSSSPKHILTIVDGIVAGEGEGPLRPRPKATGLLAVGRNPAYLDAVLARSMGYCIPRVPLVYHALYHRASRFCGPKLDDFSVSHVAADGTTRSVEFYNLPVFNLEKPHLWRRAEVPGLASRHG